MSNLTPRIDLIDASIAPRDNILINGDMRVNQRGNIILNAAESAVSNTDYEMDRWSVGYDTVGVTSAGLEWLSTNQPPALSGSRSVRFTSSTAGTPTGFMQVNQQVEDFALYAGKTVTLSAWVNSNTDKAELRIYDGVSAFESSSHSGTGSIGNPVWEFISVTATLSSSISQLRLQGMLFKAGNIVIADNDFIEFTGAKLELGSIATPFVADSFGDSLRKCQRYCRMIKADTGFTFFGNGSVINSTIVRIFIPLSVVMFGIPSITLSAASDYTIEGITTPLPSAIVSYGTTSTTGLVIQATVSGAIAGQSAILLANNNTTAYILAEAEL